MAAEDIFRDLQTNYQKGVFSKPTTFYFSIDELKKTLTLDSDGCHIQDGKIVERADCMCKTSAKMLHRIWNDGYKPGVMDFMGGAIKSNAPQLLQQFLKAFGR